MFRCRVGVRCWCGRLEHGREAGVRDLDSLLARRCHRVLATFLLTIFRRDLTEGIVVGFALGAVLFINRMAETTGIEDGNTARERRQR